MSEKPLVRWTVGPARSDVDDLILKRSVKNFRLLYGDSFDCVLCFNGRGVRDFEGLEINTVEQSPVDGLPEPHGVVWKLYPPRLRPNSHEIFIDHDVVLVDRLPQIDAFLSRGDAFLYSESPPDSRNYGRFNALVKEGFRLNSGLFGVPPGFEFDFSLVGEWEDYFDEQGFVAASLCRKKNLVKVGLEDLWICDSEEIPRAKGYHFVHDGRDDSWLRFLRMATI